MRLAFSTNAFTDGSYTLTGALEHLARIGYQGVEVLADRPLLWVPDLDPVAIRAIATTLGDLGLGVSNVNGFTCSGYEGARDRPPGQEFGPSFHDPNPTRRRFKIDYTRQVIDLTRAIGGRDVSVGSGYPPEDGDREGAWERLVEGLRACVAHAEPQGVRVNLEYEPDLLAGTAADAARLLEAIPSPAFGLNFDIGHAWVAGEEVIPEIHRFGPRIHNVHFEDIATDRQGKRVHYHLVPGDGGMPLRAIVSALSETGYEGYLTVELYNHFHHPVEVAEQSYVRMRELVGA